VFQDSIKNMVDEIAEWLFAISWRPFDTQLVPAHLAETPPSAITLFRSVKSILPFPALTASTSLKQHGQKIHQAQR
jgi:hypothetical protein